MPITQDQYNILTSPLQSMESKAAILKSFGPDVAQKIVSTGIVKMPDQNAINQANQNTTQQLQQIRNTATNPLDVHNPYSQAHPIASTLESTARNALGGIAAGAAKILPGIMAAGGAVSAYGIDPALEKIGVLPEGTSDIAKQDVGQAFNSVNNGINSVSQAAIGAQPGATFNVGQVAGSGVGAALAALPSTLKTGGSIIANKLAGSTAKNIAKAASDVTGSTIQPIAVTTPTRAMFAPGIASQAADDAKGVLADALGKNLGSDLSTVDTSTRDAMLAQQQAKVQQASQLYENNKSFASPSGDGVPPQTKAAWLKINENNPQAQTALKNYAVTDPNQPLTGSDLMKVANNIVDPHNRALFREAVSPGFAQADQAYAEANGTLLGKLTQGATDGGAGKLTAVLNGKTPNKIDLFKLKDSMPPDQFQQLVKEHISNAVTNSYSSVKGETPWDGVVKLATSNNGKNWEQMKNLAEVADLPDVSKTLNTIEDLAPIFKANKTAMRYRNITAGVVGGGGLLTEGYRGVLGAAYEGAKNALGFKHD